MKKASSLFHLALKIPFSFIKSLFACYRSLKSILIESLDLIDHFLLFIGIQKSKRLNNAIFTEK